MLHDVALRGERWSYLPPRLALALQRVDEFEAFDIRTMPQASRVRTGPFQVGEPVEGGPQVQPRQPALSEWFGAARCPLVEHGGRERSRLFAPHDPIQLPRPRGRTYLRRAAVAPTSRDSPHVLPPAAPQAFHVSANALMPKFALPPAFGEGSVIL